MLARLAALARLYPMHDLLCPSYECNNGSCGCQYAWPKGDACEALACQQLKLRLSPPALRPHCYQHMPLTCLPSS